MMTPRRTGTATLVLCALGLLAITACGTPGVPQPPSLKLPQRITDLAAVRAGNQVTLTWTTPKRDTDKVILKGNITASICRRAEKLGACDPAAEISVPPGTQGTFTETLPAALASDSPRPLAYFVELKNHKGRSAGRSNESDVLAGQSPAPVASLTAEPHKEGVALHWNTGSATESIRLYRTLLTPPAKKEKSGPLAAPAEPTEQKLLIDSDTGRALDKAVNYGETYQYRAQRIIRVQTDGTTLELSSEISIPVSIQVNDVFPPAIPTGLAAVTTPANGTTPAAIDLNWLPVTDRNLAGYAVYRSEDGSTWQRISPAQPVVGPAFHDAQVTPGHAYHYAVTAVSQTGHASQRSTETEESVPNQ